MIFSHDSINYVDPYGKNYLELSNLFMNVTISFNHCYELGLLGNDSECDLGENTYKIIYDSNLEARSRLLCPFCHIINLFVKTPFSYGRL